MSIAPAIIENARAISIESEIARRGIVLKRKGRELVGACPRCGGNDQFAVAPRSGLWNCRQCKPKAVAGDVIGLIQWLDGCGFSEAVATLTGERPQTRTVLRNRATPQQAEPSADDYVCRQHGKAAWLWSRRKPIAGSPAERYLREARGYTGPSPSTLAFLPPRKPDHPAMMAAFALCDEPEPGVVGEPQNVNAVHLTLLKPDGSGKADVKPNKLIIGRPLGRPIVLAPPNDLLGLAITEGVEDALTAHQATGLGAWAAGAAGFMPALAETIPDYIEAVTVYAHHDKAGQNGARKLAEALHRRDIEVLIEGIAG